MGAYVIPAFEAEATIASIVRELLASTPQPGTTPVVVVDDGSNDRTAEQARAAGAIVVRHTRNSGKGAALRTGLRWAQEQGHTTIVTLDADGQHPTAEAVRLLHHPASADSLLIGVRDLAGAGAPTANQRSNAFSNLVLSAMAGRRLLDTQCGLRRYPVAQTLALGVRAAGFAFEADVVLRAARRGWPIVHVPCKVIYPRDRTTHFHSVRDPARIVGRVVWAWLRVPHRRWPRRLLEQGLQALALLFVVVLSLHVVIGKLAKVSPPGFSLERPLRVDRGLLRTVGKSSALRRQGIWEVLLRGSPAEIGFAHSTLLRDEMVLTERSLLGTFEHYVPAAFARRLLLDIALFQFRDVHRGMAPARLEELAAESAAFKPDPFEAFLPTYQRFVYLNALYDISLSLEHSPLLGCTTFTADPAGTETGPLLARVFDFEVHDVFDRQKAVFFVAEEGELPFASVAWPGLVGVVSGMNLAGVSLVVHGARGGTFTSKGEPVVHAVRRVLGSARTTEEAFQLFGEQPAMVSHIIVAQDAHGHAARIERAPGRQATFIELGGLAVSSNHFEGPLSADPKNLRVMRETSTLVRRARGDLLIRAHHGVVTPSTLAAWLRDRKAVDGAELAAGDRRAIDAGIATHAVIMDTSRRTLWVSQGPHLEGDFVRYELEAVFGREGLLEPGSARPTLGSVPTGSVPPGSVSPGQGG